MKKSMIVFFVFALFFSCTKEKTKPDILVEKINILTAGVWQFSDYKYSDHIFSTITIYTDLPACRQDDLRNFNRDSTGEFNEGPGKCNSTDPQSQPVRWRFLDKYASSIEINGQEYSIDKLESNKFRIHQYYVGSDVWWEYSR